MRDFYNYVWRKKLWVWLTVFAFCFLFSVLVRLVLGRPDWVYILASAFGWASSVLLVAHLKRDR